MQMKHMDMRNQEIRTGSFAHYHGLRIHCRHSAAALRNNLCDFLQPDGYLSTEAVMKTETMILPELEMVSVPTPVAPWWHTALLIIFFMALAAGGSVLQRGARSQANLVAHRPNMIPIYISLIVMQWGLIYYIWKGGLRRRGISILQLVGGRWQNLRAVIVDILLAFGIWALWMGISYGLQRVAGPNHAASISPMLPRGVAETILWVMVSISAGISEELTFRGYLQRQFAALTGSLPMAFILQILVFGIAHAYQGALACLACALYGVLFTFVALWRKSLRPDMIAHAWTDTVAGLLW
jgi:membrane protease YdiL (CAAX protease family)